MRRSPRLLTMMALLLCASASCAEWVKTGEADGSTYYIERSKIAKEGVIVKALIMTDQSAPKTDPVNQRKYLSDQTLWAFDCNARKYKHLIVEEYEGRQMAGAVVAIVDLELSLGSRNLWKSPEPDSVAAYFTKTVCQFTGFK